MANTNPTDFEEIEHKKWLTDRVFFTFRTTIDDFKLMSDKLEKIEQDEKEKIIGRRNNLLSPVGVVLTIILAVFSTGKLNFNTFIIILIGDMIIGLLIYFIGNLYLKTNSGVFTEIYNKLNDSIKSLQLPLGHINALVYSLNDVTVELLDNYMTFGHLLGVGQLLSIQKKLEKLSKEKHITAFTRNSFIMTSNQYKELLNTIPLSNIQFELHEKIPKEWYEPSKELIEEYFKK